MLRLCERQQRAPALSRSCHFARRLAQQFGRAPYSFDPARLTGINVAGAGAGMLLYAMVAEIAIGPMQPPDASDRVLILVVERDPHIKKLEQFFLEQAGYRVEFADDGVQGLERARALIPRILVTEILLPRLDGLKVCRALKSDAATAGIAVLVFSILAAEDRALEAGADAFLRKPLDDARLVDTVTKLLRYRSEADA